MLKLRQCRRHLYSELPPPPSPCFSPSPLWESGQHRVLSSLTVVLHNITFPGIWGQKPGNRASWRVIAWRLYGILMYHSLIVALSLSWYNQFLHSQLPPGSLSLSLKHVIYTLRFAYILLSIQFSMKNVAFIQRLASIHKMCLSRKSCIISLRGSFAKRTTLTSLENNNKRKIALNDRWNKRNKIIRFSSWYKIKPSKVYFFVVVIVTPLEIIFQ